MEKDRQDETCRKRDHLEGDREEEFNLLIGGRKKRERVIEMEKLRKMQTVPTISAQSCRRANC